jgi:predicted RNA-binding Zn ribbon-like protein
MNQVGGASPGPEGVARGYFAVIGRGHRQSCMMVTNWLIWESAMAEGSGLFPPGWLRAAGGESADDLELAVLLVNSHDELADPPDRLAAVDWYVAVLRAVGHPAHAAALGPGDLGVLRALRGGLRAAFTAASPEAAALALNPLLLTAAAVPVLVSGPDGDVQLRVAPGAIGLPALAARLPTALAAHIARYGLTRLGSCAAHPCACVYVDRTRAGNRRYCCDLCNDRAAAAAYRNRHRPVRKKRPGADRRLDEGT